MAYTLAGLPALKAAAFDAIIDVRSPAEFAEDHLPGAVNMPVLSDHERAEVGTIYTQQSPFQARKIGAALVARNAAAAIETHLAHHDGGWRPLVYCWRGGQRSGAFAAILRQIGWRVKVLEGGYQSWRRHVVERLYDSDLPFRVFRLDGFTGTAKTEVLRRVAHLGGQVIDLEGLARHRGSILGDVDGCQPAQKGFESALMEVIAGFDPERPLLLEAESARIGALRLPPALWRAMKESPRFVMEAPIAARARYLVRTYADFITDPGALAVRLQGLTQLAGRERVEEWLKLLREGRADRLAEALIRDHYDPAYLRLRRRDNTPVAARVPLKALDDASIDEAAGFILSTIAP